MKDTLSLPTNVEFFGVGAIGRPLGSEWPYNYSHVIAHRGRGPARKVRVLYRSVILSTGHPEHDYSC